MQINEREKIAAEWFESLRNKICSEFEKIEEDFLAKMLNGLPRLENSAPFYNKPQKFTRKKWFRDALEGSGGQGGGGEMSVMKGNVFEKVGVNISTTYGSFNEQFRGQIPGTENNANYFATGISLVAHMASPLVPAAHFNTRFIHTEKEWFGGGGDLNPMFEITQDTQDFHQTFKNACDAYDSRTKGYKENFHVKSNYSVNSIGAGDGAAAANTNTPRNFKTSYEKFKQECDEYFFIKHRGVSRGVGGIFYDYLNSGNFENDFKFTQEVGLAFAKIYPEIIRRHMFESFTAEQREYQFKKRGFYTEYNLLYDRGTKFGLMTGGNVEAILMSLPPVAKWD